LAGTGGARRRLAPGDQPVECGDRRDPGGAGDLERIRLVGNDPSPSSPEAFKARIAADIDKWTKVVDAARIERI
jgi:hypothetical protein